MYHQQFKIRDASCDILCCMSLPLAFNLFQVCHPLSVCLAIRSSIRFVAKYVDFALGPSSKWWTLQPYVIYIPKLIGNLSFRSMGSNTRLAKQHDQFVALRQTQFPRLRERHIFACGFSTSWETRVKASLFCLRISLFLVLMNTSESLRKNPRVRFQESLNEIFPTWNNRNSCTDEFKLPQDKKNRALQLPWETYARRRWRSIDFHLLQLFTLFFRDGYLAFFVHLNK